MTDLNLDYSSRPLALGSPTRIGCISAVALFILVFGLYFRTTNFQFVEYDDQDYIYANVHIITGFTLANIRDAMTAIINGNWHPLTTLCWLMLASLFGVTAGPFHFVNAFLHALNTALLFEFLKKGIGRLWLAFFAAALWGLHPQRVESVAWACELKDTLCGTMWLGCLLTYLRYSAGRSVGRYLVVTIFMILAILSKPIAVTLPFVLLLLDYWPIGASEESRSRWWTNRVLEKLPLMLLSGVAVAIGIRSQYKAHTNASPWIYPASLRLKNGLVSYIAYLRDTFAPSHLSAFYPHPGMVEGAGITWAAAILAGVVLLILSTIVSLQARSKPYLFVGWFWFLGTLVPVIGIVQSGEQARADRFTYFPAMGLAIALVWLVADLVKARPAVRSVAYVTGAAALIGLAWVSNNDISYWRDGPTMFARMLEVQPDNYLALAIKGSELQSAGQYDRAIAMDEKALSIAPKSETANLNYVLALRAVGRYPEAVAVLEEALSHNPWSNEAWDALGGIRDKQATEAQARHLPTEMDFRRRATLDFSRALHVAPDMFDASEHLAYELAAQGQLDEAISVWKALVNEMPGYAQAQGDLADALRLKKYFSGAVEHYQAAIAAGSRNPAWETELAYLVASNPQAEPKDVQPMVAIAKDACEQTHYHDAAALDSYAACLYRVGRIDDSITAARQGVAQANAAHEPAIASEIQKRLALYQRGLPYVAQEVEAATSKPAASK